MNDHIRQIFEDRYRSTFSIYENPFERTCRGVYASDVIQNIWEGFCAFYEIFKKESLESNVDLADLKIEYLLLKSENKKLKEYNDNCISRTLHDARVSQLDSDIEQLKASYDELKKQLSVDFQYQTIEQLKAEIDARKVSYYELDEINTNLNYKIQQLKSKLEIAKKGLEMISLDNICVGQGGWQDEYLLNVKQAKEALKEIEG